MMLEALPRANVTKDVHRFANLSHLAVFANKKGLTIGEIIDVIAFDRGDVIRELIEAPFQRKQLFGNTFGPVSRFSDGSWPVFYAAIGRTTAERESVHHYGRKAAGGTNARRAVHYSIVRCRFSGYIVDLQPKLPDWPGLISEDYRFCNSLGQEAHDAGLGGFLSPSARNVGGTTVPAFLPGTISDPQIEATARLAFDRANIIVEINEVP